MKKFISMAIAFAMASIMSVSAFAAVSPTATTPSAKPTTATTTEGTATTPVSKVVPTAKNQITVSWSSVKGATKYEIYRRVGNTGAFVLVGTTTSASYVDKLAKAGNYTYKVRALVDGSYKDSAVIAVSMMNFKTMPKTKFAKAKKKTLKVQIKKKVVGATGYQVKYSLKNLKKSKYLKKAKAKTLSAKKKTLTIKKLKSGRKYYVRVRAYQTINGKKVYGKWSKVVTKVVK